MYKLASKLLLCTASTLCLTLQVSAQTLPKGPTGTVPDDSKAADSSIAGLEEVVITAQRREQRLQDVPIAVSAVNADTLAQTNITTVIDIGKVVPSAVVQPALGSVLTFIRGIGNGQPTLGNEAANAVYIDGVYISRLSPIALKLNDVQRVEVLRGPQGTLFGRNSEGGLIQIVTKTPSPGDSLRMALNVGYDNFETVEPGAYISSGLGPNAALSASFAYKDQQDGFGDNRVAGDHLKGREYAGRTKLVLTPADRTTFTLAVDYSHSKSDIGLAQLYRIDGATASDPGGQSGLPPLGLELAPIYGFYDSTTNDPHYFENTLYGGSFKVEQELGFAMLANTAAYRHSDESLNIDVDLTADSFSRLRGDGVSKQFTNELQLISTSGGNFDWTLGAFYFSNKFGYEPFQLAGPILGAGPSGALRQTASGDTESIAGYGQATIRLLPDLRLTLGGRYTQIDLEARNRLDFLIGPVLVVSPVPYEKQTEDFEKVTWKVGLDYTLGGTLLYLSASTGYKDGLFNIGTLGPLGAPVKPESLDAYELGIKGESFENRLRYQLAGFYYEQQDSQVYIVLNNATSLINAGKASVTGAELEADVYINSRLALRGAITYLDAKYDSFDNAPYYEPNPSPPYGLIGPFARDGSGAPLPRAPELSASFGFEYEFPLGDGELSLVGNCNYVSRYYFDVDKLGKSGNYSLVDSQISYRFASSNVTVSLWGSNLLNEEFYVADQEVLGMGGLEGVANEPRRYGVRLSYNY